MLLGIAGLVTTYFMFGGFPLTMTDGNSMALNNYLLAGSSGALFILVTHTANEC